MQDEASCHIKKVQAEARQPLLVTPHFSNAALSARFTPTAIQRRTKEKEATKYKIKNADHNERFSRISTVPFEPHFSEKQLDDRRTITVKGAATGYRDRSRRNTSAASTSVREAHDGNRGWGGTIYIMWRLPPLSPYLEDFISSLETTLLTTHSDSYPDPEIHDERQPQRRDPITIPISASARSAFRQARVQQCCHRC